MKKILLSFAITCVLPVQIFAADTTDTSSMITQLRAILDQYAVRIQALENENKILKEEIAKAGIKIPLSVFGPAIATGSTSLSTGTTLTTNTGTTSVNLTGALQDISTTYGARYANFIKKIHTEWVPIQGAYKLPSTSYIGGYEFVKQGNDNHVFVDIINNPQDATSAYDVKILYEYNTGTYQRKLIGFFEYNRATGYYSTKSGTNPFAGVERTFVRDPYGSSVIVPPTATTGGGTSGSSSGTVISGGATTAIPSLTDIDKAYADKRYLSVISLSNSYLTANPPTYELLRLRYRTYFIIGKYNESLAEIAKIEALGKLSTVACDAKIIATYSKNTSLITKYTSACKE